LDLRELLSIPYLLEQRPPKTEPGEWLIRSPIRSCLGALRKGRSSETVLRTWSGGRIENDRCLVEEGKNLPFHDSPLAGI